MNIPVLLEPISTGFRASTGAPLNLTAEAPTADEALKSLRREFIQKQIAGARVVEFSLPPVDPVNDAIKDLAANPFFDEWVAATKAYRRQREAEEDAAEAAAEAEKAKGSTGNGGLRSSSAQQEPAA
jgi:hypothetical protein